jgi:hypothetical protein
MHSASCPRSGNISPSSGGVAIELVNVTMHEILLAAVLTTLQVVVVFLVHVRIGGGKGRIDILRPGFVFGSLTLLHVVDVGLLQRTILIESPADKVCRVGQIHLLSLLPDVQSLRARFPF